MSALKPGWLKWLLSLPQQAAALLKGKADTIAYSIAEAPSALRLSVQKEALRRVKEQAVRLLSAPAGETPSISPEDESLIRWLRDETARRNRNNVTRTGAYLDMYAAHPELHWALLAHLVSRNGGFTMTDLKGELLPRLLGAGQREALFRFLERANGLIFHDAYPQLLLYRESARSGRSLTRLLPRLGVSAFMRPVWDEFATSRDSVLLTCALIVNEQQYIQRRVVDNPYFKKHVLDTLAFKTQSLLQLNQVVFPYEVPERGTSRVRLAGLILENFADLAERIRFGQRLYAILFGLPDVAAGAHAFVRRQPHTGSVPIIGRSCSPPCAAAPPSWPITRSSPAVQARASFPAPPPSTARGSNTLGETVLSPRPSQAIGSVTSRLCSCCRNRSPRPFRST
ncbi:DUF2515 family protein [Gordoniibacillus kamchatkensis]|uniref:DUF2515 family protein n=1 Tax=Gordoniibacillus kamchatkensis TaxID=1590651 RepID=UPI000697D53F